MDIITLWARYYAQLGWAAFSLILAIVCIRLLLNKRTGHRTAVKIWLQFAVTTFIRSFFVAVDIFYHGHSTQTWIFTLNSLSAIWAGAYLLLTYADVETTLMRTQTAHVLEIEEILDGQTSHNYNRYINEESTKITREALEQQKQIFASQS